MTEMIDQIWIYDVRKNTHIHMQTLWDSHDVGLGFHEFVLQHIWLEPLLTDRNQQKRQILLHCIVDCLFLLSAYIILPLCIF